MAPTDAQLVRMPAEVRYMILRETLHHRLAIDPVAAVKAHLGTLFFPTKRPIDEMFTVPSDCEKKVRNVRRNLLPGWQLDHKLAASLRSSCQELKACVDTLYVKNEVPTLRLQVIQLQSVFWQDEQIIPVWTEFPLGFDLARPVNLEVTIDLVDVKRIDRCDFLRGFMSFLDAMEVERDDRESLEYWAYGQLPKEWYACKDVRKLNVNVRCGSKAMVEELKALVEQKPDTTALRLMDPFANCEVEITCSLNVPVVDLTV